jgi:hypothetical protein
MNKNARKIVYRDINQGDILPGDEILEGKRYKQTGFMYAGLDKNEYWLERIPGTETRQEFWNYNSFTLEEHDAALFEIHIKNPTTGDWELIAAGPLPTDAQVWRDMGEYFLP